MRGGLNRRVGVASALLAVTIAAGFAVLLVELVALRGTTRDERHAALTREAMDSLFVDVLNLETGQRAYALTQQKLFLQPWREGRRRLAPDSRTVVALAAADPQQESTARRAAAQARSYLVNWSEPVVALAAHDRTAAAARVATGGGKRRVDALRRTIAAFDARQEALAASRRHASDSAVAVAIAAGTVGAVGSFVLILLFAGYLWRIVLRPVRRVASAAAQAAGGDLEVRVPVEGAGEVALLADSFNRMAESVVAGRSALEQRAAELAEANTVSQAVLDSTVDGICLTDLQGTILLANAPMARYVAELGIPTEGTIYERLMAIAPRFEQADDYVDAMRKIAANPAARTMDEFRFVDNGRSFRGYTAPVRDSAGGFVGRIFTLREVTAERESERLKDEFVATVSHELRTPLTSILGYLELVLDDEALEPTQRDHLEVVSRNARRLLRVVGDLLFVAQVESGALHLVRAPVDPSRVAAETVEAAQPVAAERGIALVLDAEPVGEIEADGTRLNQLLDNLVSNAVKFTPSGGSVTVRVRAENDSLVLSVVDTGAGIPPEEQERLFTRFFRSERSHRLAVPGTGLGLAIVHAIATAHGGRVAVWSQEGRGATFTVTIPIERVASPAAT